ncbi:hypothetical protein ZWY2020_037634 [Hordeum vulgare]|nr:hypothetical protein ZWY2020_037634 [Hordeum vulgare]
MVSWSDGESSESSAPQHILSSDSPIKIPTTIDDPYFDGVAEDFNVMCEHGNQGKKCVAFEGISIGRRFISCATENALHKLWLMYEDSKHDNRIACVKHLSTVHNLTEVVINQLKFIHVAQGNVIRNFKFNHLKEKEKMSSHNMTLKFCFADLKKEKEKLDGCIAELMKDKEKLSIEKNTLECCIVDLKKGGENNKRKLKETKGICDEE